MHRRRGDQLQQDQQAQCVREGRAIQPARRREKQQRHGGGHDRVAQGDVQERLHGGYSFLRELAASKVQQISIEAAQPRLDLTILRDLPGKTIILGVIDLADTAVETPQIVAARIRSALTHVSPERLVVAPFDEAYSTLRGVWGSLFPAA